jgi:hypothetical protein
MRIKTTHQKAYDKWLLGNTTYNGVFMTSALSAIDSYTYEVELFIGQENVLDIALNRAFIDKDKLNEMHEHAKTAWKVVMEEYGATSRFEKVCKGICREYWLLDFLMSSVDASNDDSDDDDDDDGDSGQKELL